MIRVHSLFKNCVVKAAISLTIFSSVLALAGAANAAFFTFRLKNYNSGLCLASYSGIDDLPGNGVIQWYCDGGEGQRWRADYVWPSTSTVRISSRAVYSSGIPGLCVEVGGSMANGAPLFIDSCDGATDQQWTLVSAPGYSMPGTEACYKVVNVNSQKYMAIPWSSTEPSEVIQYSSSSPPTADAYWCLFDKVFVPT